MIAMRMMNDGDKKHVRSDKIHLMGIRYIRNTYDEKHEILTHCHRKASNHDDELSTVRQRNSNHEEDKGKVLTIVLIMCMFLPLTVKQDHQPAWNDYCIDIKHTDPNSEAHEAGMRLASAASKYEGVKMYSWMGAAMRP